MYAAIVGGTVCGIGSTRSRALDDATAYLDGLDDDTDVTLREISPGEAEALETAGVTS